MDAGKDRRYLAVGQFGISALEGFMIRWLGFGGVLLAASLVPLACGGDTTLEDLGGAVQATRLAQATIRTHNLTTTPMPTPTPEPAVLADLRELRLQSRNIRSFVDFLDLRLAGSDALTVGSLGDDEGNLAEGWLEACCASQWESAKETASDAAVTVLSIQAFYEDEALEEQVQLVPAIQAQLDELRGTLDSFPAASNTDAARLLTSAGLDILNLMDGAIEAVSICCGQAPATPTPSPTPSPAMTPTPSPEG